MVSESRSTFDLRSAYSGKTVLVTGHTGFKGAWMVAWLQRLGARVAGFALPAETPSLFQAAGLHAGITHTEGDVRDREALADFVRRVEPEIVLHLAAQPLVRQSYTVPVDTFAVNVMGTAHLLDACRTAESVRAIVVITTDKVYENREWPWPYREVDRLGGHDPYSSSKACAEIVTQAYRDSFFGAGLAGARETQTSAARIASARAGNVIGGGDWARDRILPDIVRAAEAKKVAAIRNPRAVRPWQHVLDPIAGYLLLGVRLARGDDVAQAWNFGPPDEQAVSVERIARRFVHLLGLSADDTLELMSPEPAAPKETLTLRLDSSKARTILGWRPLLSVDEAVDLAARWYRAFLEDSSAARPVLDAQIAEYEARLVAASDLT